MSQRKRNIPAWLLEGFFMDEAKKSQQDLSDQEKRII
jgi:hypothetical protein